MKQIQLINDDYSGRVEHLRHACRGVLVHDGKVLLGYETNYDKYIIPGGGVEGDETFAGCCEREMLEETGMAVRATQEFVQIEELFEDWRHICHYFVCDLLENTGSLHLTEAEEEAGCISAWIPLEEAVEIFGQYEKFHNNNIADYGLYRREFRALKEYQNIIQDPARTP